MIPDEVLRPALESITGDIAVLAGDVRYDLKQPCNDCPFMKSSPYHQGVAKSLPDYVRSIDAGQFAHTCHKTDPRAACDGPRPSDGRPVQHCLGSILMLLKTGGKAWYQPTLLKAWDDKKIDLIALEKIAKADKNIFTVRQMLRFYLEKLNALRVKP